MAAPPKPPKPPTNHEQLATLVASTAQILAELVELRKRLDQIQAEVINVQRDTQR